MKMRIYRLDDSTVEEAEHLKDRGVVTENIDGVF
jgi:hypothetical protein